MKRTFNENQKITLTVGQIRRLIKETAISDLEPNAEYSEMQDILSDAGFEDFCKQLNFLVTSSDPKAKALFDTFKKGWKDEFSGIKVTREFVGIRDLHPTQNVIFAKKSLVPMLNGSWKVGSRMAVDLVLSDKGVEIPMDPPSDPIVVCSVGGVPYLIDGHHRWSKFYAFNPTCKMDAFVIHGSFKDADEVLKFAQGTLAATGKTTVNPQKGGDINMYGGSFSIDVLGGIVSENLSPEVLNVVKSAKLTSGLVTDETSLRNYLWQNISITMYNFAPVGDHDREYMPQFPDGDTNPANAVDRIAAESTRPLSHSQLNDLMGFRL